MQEIGIWLEKQQQQTKSMGGPILLEKQQQQTKNMGRPISLRKKDK